MTFLAYYTTIEQLLKGHPTIKWILLILCLKMKKMTFQILVFNSKMRFTLLNIT